MGEVAVLQKLQHPNIIAYRDSFRTPATATLSIVMEHAAGGDVGSAIEAHSKSGTRFDEAFIIKVLAQSVDALAYCHHDLHLLHRDLKPENIFLSGAGDVKVEHRSRPS